MIILKGNIVTIALALKKNKMARSHHRKKHKAHLRQYQHEHNSTAAATPKGKAVKVFIVAGAIIGLAVSYFASERSIVWSIVGIVAGAGAGYFLGNSIDKQNSK